MALKRWSMLSATNVPNGTYECFCVTNEELWRVSLALDLEERSVLEGEVLLARITEQSSAQHPSTVAA
jgi:hypothetical protein